jgi:hypothetical protein
MVDCSKRGADKGLGQKYGVRGYPTVVFTDATGKQVEKLARRDANSVKAQIGRVVEKYGKAPEKAIHDNIAEATEAAKEKKALIAIVFTDEKKSNRKKNEALMALLKSDDMGDTKAKFVWVLRPLRDDQGKKINAEAKQYKASSSATVVIVDPNKEGKKAILKKLLYSKSLKKSLDKVLKKHAG